MKLNAKQLRSHQPGAYSDQLKKKLKRKEVYIILDNVLDTYNIGSIFRLADAVGVKKLYLCGGSETPPNHRIKKASINTTEWVEWEYCDTATDAISALRAHHSQLTTHSSRLQVIAVEQTKNSIPYDKFDYHLPIALVVGHETDGVSPETLKLVDAIVELPMYGVNKSLNVMVSLGIVLYQIIEQVKLES